MHRADAHLVAVCVVGLAFSAIAAAAERAPPGWRETARQFAADHIHRPAWGYSQSVRDYEPAATLARKDDIALDDDVFYAAAYLHDIAAFAPWDLEAEGSDYADAGARVLDEILQGTGFPMQRIEALRRAILTHMLFRTLLALAENIVLLDQPTS